MATSLLTPYAPQINRTPIKAIRAKCIDCSGAVSQLTFLEEVLTACAGEKLALSEYAPDGLARILCNIGHDVWQAHGYYIGEDPTPGIDPDAREVSHHE